MKLLAITSNIHFFTDIANNINQEFTDPHGMLHCTACYLGNKGNPPYHTCASVVNSLYKPFNIKVTGFGFSRRAIFAMVDLYTGGKDEEKLLNLYVKEEENGLREELERARVSEEAFNLARHGCSAHITISYQKTGQARYSGDEMLRIVEFRAKGMNSGVLDTDDWHFVNFDEELCALFLKSPLQVETLFHGFYTAGRR